MLLWIVQLGYKAGAAAAPPVVTPSAKGAGRSRRRRKYIIRIEGRVFEAEDESQAIAILEQAQVLAEKAASNRADEIVEKALPKAISLGAVKPIAIKAPTVQVSEALQAQADATQAAIDRAYANASAIAELRLLLALRAAEEDEEEFLLLH
jgi:translation initiation factor IF-2